MNLLGGSWLAGLRRDDEDRHMRPVADGFDGAAVDDVGEQAVAMGCEGDEVAVCRLGDPEDFLGRASQCELKIDG